MEHWALQEDSVWQQTNMISRTNYKYILVDMFAKYKKNYIFGLTMFSKHNYKYIWILFRKPGQSQGLL